MQPWHWLALSLLFFIIELMVPSFVSLALGLAALFIALIAWLWHGSWLVIVSLWLILSVVFVAIGLLYIKPKLRRTKANLKHGIDVLVGQVGMIVISPTDTQLGKIRFFVPLLGADEWLCRNQNAIPIAVGERAIVLDIVGNELLVKAMTDSH